MSAAQHRRLVRPKTEPGTGDGSLTRVKKEKAPEWTGDPEDFLSLKVVEDASLNG